jgi:hypothetical protein
MIEVKDCKSGYILKGIENHKVVYVNGKTIKGHFIIFSDHLNVKDFIGAMITSTNYNGVTIGFAGVTGQKCYLNNYAEKILNHIFKFLDLQDQQEHLMVLYLYDIFQNRSSMRFLLTFSKQII